MPIPGSRLDRFEILELLGAGAMGEVYRAHDSRLGRDVALKVLPERLLGEASRRARFEREAQVLASLNHPNIAALYEVVELPNGHALVLELVLGETLADCIARGALPVSEALGIGAQIAAALQAAHDQGIVHRDLKPGNVVLRPDGTVKVLDFGLAKVFDPAAPEHSAAVTLTAIGAPGLAEGHILGSPAYMSPEQARGLPVDKRTDVWAFGCLVYEMLSGTRAFAGEQSADVIARILEREPDFAALPPSLPPTVTRVLRRCLEKDQRRRLRDIGDASIELLEALERPAVEPTATGPFAARASLNRSTAPLRMGLAIGGMALLVGAVLWFTSRPRRPPPSLPVKRFEIVDRGLSADGVAISADGSQIAYVSDRGLVVRALDRLESRVLVPNNAIQGQPFFSPDGQWVGFKGWESLRKVPVAGGAAVTLLGHIFPEGAWAGNDIFYGDTRGLFRVPAAGGMPEELLATEGVEQIGAVEVLPERRAVLYTVISTRGNVPGMAASLPSARLEALDLRTGKRHVVLRGGGRGRITRTGHLLYVSGGTLYAIGFDSEQLQVRGAAVPVIATEGQLDFAVSNEGSLVYISVGSGEDRELVWVDRKGHEESLGAPPMTYLYPQISPDGNRVALDAFDKAASRDVWVWDMRRTTLELFTKDPAGNPIATWSPDGRDLVFGSERSGVSNVYRQAADGSGEPERVLPSDQLQMPIRYTPDGRLLVSVDVAGQHRDIYLMSMHGRRGATPLIHSPANELTADVSPDGRWIAYDSDESGQFEVHVRPFPDAYGGGHWQISSGGGRQPVWSHDGRELFYRDFSGALVAVPVNPGSRFVPGRPAVLFRNAAYLGAGAQGSGRTFDVAKDGRRFLMLKVLPSQEPKLVVVLNWFDELRRLAPIH